MVKLIQATASPEKRLFISLLTRDIPLSAAFLDLIDNSVNAAIEPHANLLRTAKDYLDVFENKAIKPTTSIQIWFNAEQVKIIDKADGIPLNVASDHVFKFGRAEGEYHESDRLSVYGIGLKRAIFKLGNHVIMTSDHKKGGFELDLDVNEWAKVADARWTIPIRSRNPVEASLFGTSITVTELYDEVKRRLSDGVFEAQLRDAVSRTYAYFMSKFVKISVNDKPVDGVDIAIGANHISETFEFDGVTCAITAGIGSAENGQFRDRSSGWFVFCNGRAVISADKSQLTGWGTGTGLPIFQPKHRLFLGTVFFVSTNAEKLPWTTTKAAINEDSAVWQTAKRHMINVGRRVTTFLDSRYTDEGTEFANRDLEDAAGARVSVLSAAVSQQSTFKPVQSAVPKTIKVRYHANPTDIKKIAHYLKRPSMSGSDVGRHTFNYFLRNQVGEK